MPDPPPRSIRFLRVERASDSIRKQLAAFDQILGIQGWVVGTESGEVLFTSMQPTLNYRILDTVGKHVVGSSTGLEGGEPANEVEVNFTHGSVLAHKIGSGWLIVCCDLQADLAMARMTLSVTAATLTTEKSLQNMLSLPAQSVPPDNAQGS
jgi:predicted regulator of Ras-like GTPase activity (Roadblock/LC7/MglB family)